MHRLDRGDDRDVRPDQPGEPGDLAGVIHADLEHGEARRLGQARERERHAPMVVVGSRRSVRLGLRAEHQAQRILGARLADRPGHREDLCARAGARGAREIIEGGEHVGHDEERRIRRHRRAARLGDHRERGAARECGRDELVAVAILAANG